MALKRIYKLHRKKHSGLSFTLARHLTEQVQCLTQMGMKRTYLLNYSTLYTLQKPRRGAQLSMVRCIHERAEPTLSLSLSLCLNTALSWQREWAWRRENSCWSGLLTRWLIGLCVEGSPIIHYLLLKIICCSRVMTLVTLLKFSFTFPLTCLTLYLYISNNISY